MLIRGIRLVILLLLNPFAGICAEAVFTLDEKGVYAVTAKGLVHLDLQSKQVATVPTASKFDPSVDHGLSISNAGYVLLASGDGITAYNPDKKSWVTVCRAPQETACTNVAYRPSDGSILFETLDKKDAYAYWLLQKNSAKPILLKLRRIQSMSGFSFDQVGQLYFGYRGDLWAGEICGLPDDPATGLWICGIRIAPLADLETSIGTPSNQGVQGTAPSGQLIYVHLLRLGGSGWGQIASLTLPPVSFDEGEVTDDSLPKRLQLYQDELKSVKLLGENGSYSFLCATRSGSRVFYRAQDPQDQKMKFWLVSDGKTEVLGDDSLLGTGG